MSRVKATVLGCVLAGLGCVSPALAAHPGENGLIAFQADDGNDLEIATIKKSGSGFDLVTDNLFFDFSPSWSPNGNRIAWEEEGAILTAKADGSDVEEIVPSSFGFNHDAAWSPDGKKLVFISDADSSGDDIYVTKSDGSGQPQLRTGGNAENDDPNWSPNGKLIAFEREDEADDDIFTMKPSGEGVKNLTRTSGRDEDDPNFAPQGGIIAFATAGNDAENSDIAKMKKDGSNRTTVTETGNKDEDSPAFSPDGKLISYERADPGEGDRIWISRTDGSDPKRVTPAIVGAAEDPDWQPK